MNQFLVVEGEALPIVGAQGYNDGSIMYHVLRDGEEAAVEVKVWEF